MGFYLPDKRFDTSIEDIRIQPGPTTERTFVVSLKVNGQYYTYELAESAKVRGALTGDLAVYGAYRGPRAVLYDYIRRFASGEGFSFPIDLGNIGT